ncbi:MAG: hypothetical protein WCK98_03105 [bacterium]
MFQKKYYIIIGVIVSIIAFVGITFLITSNAQKSKAQSSSSNSESATLASSSSSSSSQISSSTVSTQKAGETKPLNNSTSFYRGTIGDFPILIKISYTDSGVGKIGFTGNEIYVGVSKNLLPIEGQ